MGHDLGQILLQNIVSLGSRLSRFLLSLFPRSGQIFIARNGNVSILLDLKLLNFGFLLISLLFGMDLGSMMSRRLR